MMRQQLFDDDLEQVSGGTVYLSKMKMKVGFEATQQKFDLQNCTYQEAWGLIDAMHDEYTNAGKTGTEYEIAVRDAMRAKGWIN